MDDERHEIPDGAVLVEDGMITAVGPTEDLPSEADTVLDLRSQIVLPGMVNTHHHLDQTLTRNLPQAQNINLFPWLRAHYEIWAKRTPEATRGSTLIGLAELALSGCTTVFDHSYVFQNGCRVDDQIAAAAEIGVRFHACRGSMSLGESRGGLPPDNCVEDEGAILEDCVRVIGQYHDSDRGAMTRIVLGPCSPFSVSADLLPRVRRPRPPVRRHHAHAPVRNLGRGALHPREPQAAPGRVRWRPSAGWVRTSGTRTPSM